MYLYAFVRKNDDRRCIRLLVNSILYVNSCKYYIIIIIIHSSAAGAPLYYTGCTTTTSGRYRRWPTHFITVTRSLGPLAPRRPPPPPPPLLLLAPFGLRPQQLLFAWLRDGSHLYKHTHTHYTQHIGRTRIQHCGDSYLFQQNKLLLYTCILYIIYVYIDKYI